MDQAWIAAGNCGPLNIARFCRWIGGPMLSDDGTAPRLAHEHGRPPHHRHEHICRRDFAPLATASGERAWRELTWRLEGPRSPSLRLIKSRSSGPLTHITAQTGVPPAPSRLRRGRLPLMFRNGMPEFNPARKQLLVADKPLRLQHPAHAATSALLPEGCAAEP